jgi:hypothetical protein
MNPEQTKKVTADSIAPIVQPPKAPVLGPNIVAGIGIFMSLLGYGYQAAAANHPELISGMGGALDWAQLAAGLVTVGGLFWHTANSRQQDQQTGAAINAITQQPPADATGKMNCEITLASAVEQAMNEGKHSLAAAIVKAVQANAGPEGDGGE